MTTGETCALRHDGFIADCALDAGKATLVADADFLEDGEDASIALVKTELASLLR